MSTVITLTQLLVQKIIDSQALPKHFCLAEPSLTNKEITAILQDSDIALLSVIGVKEDQNPYMEGLVCGRTSFICSVSANNTIEVLNVAEEVCAFIRELLKDMMKDETLLIKPQLLYELNMKGLDVKQRTKNPKTIAVIEGIVSW